MGYRSISHEAAVQLQICCPELGAPSTWPQVLLRLPLKSGICKALWCCKIGLAEVFRHVTDGHSTCCVQGTEGRCTGPALLPARATHKQEAALRQDTGCKCEAYTSVQH